MLRNSWCYFIWKHEGLDKDSDSENLEKVWDYAFLGHSGAEGAAVLHTTLQEMLSYCSNNLLEEEDW